MTGCPRSFCSSFRAAICLCALLGAAMGAPVQAQVKVGALAEDLCQRPPMEEDARDRFRRRSDFMRLLEALADDCPDVAMIFLQFEVGSIDDRDAAASFDAGRFAPTWPWPETMDRNF